MVFSSVLFLFRFLPIFMICYFLVPRKMKNLVLFLGSLVFYAWGEPVYIFLMLFSTISDYVWGRLIEEYRGKDHSRIFLLCSIGINLFILGFFKYADFLLQTVNTVFGTSIPLLKLPLPIGISFYTFQTMSYVIDVYRGDTKAQRNILQFGVYVTMFPQLISGPIERYSQMKPKLTHRHLSLAGVDAGLKQFTIGLGMKMLLADRIGSCWTDIQTIGFDSISAPVAWMGIFAYSFQLYFDFYGYTLMATGIGTMMGFETPDNFTHPYESLSMTEFWRRWHMTLGSWFRDYVYIPLGGNRKAVPRVYLNLFIVWLLTGIWHGAGWNFILWGVFLFAVIAVEKAGLKKKLDARPVLGHLYMLFLIPLSWMIFAITDIGQLGVYITRLVDVLGTGSDTVYAGDFAKFIDTYGVLLLVCTVFCTSLPKQLFSKVQDTLLGTVVLFFLFWASVYLVYLGLSDPFMYFRF
mgnify:CR=1 FL=1